MPRTRYLIAALVCSVLIAATSVAADREPFDALLREQAAHEKQQMAAGEMHTNCEAMAAFRQTAEMVRYPAGEFQLPGYLYKPDKAGKLPAVLWNHGSEKMPIGHPGLARFYTSNGFAFFMPIRHGHGNAPGKYIVDLQREFKEKEPDNLVAWKNDVKLHELYNADVIAAVKWLKSQPFVDPDRIIMTGVSYGGIQTLLAAEKGEGVRGFIPFAPAAMSFANTELQERLKLAVKNAKAPVFLLQAENDYNIGPSKILAPILEHRGSPNRSKVYPPFGKTNQEGHGAFACWSLGITGWGTDVLDFIDAAFVQK